MKHLLSILTSRLPSKAGRAAYDQLMKALEHGGVQFAIRQVTEEPGASYFLAESTNVPNKHIITTGTTLAELEHHMRDAIFTAFQVPAYYCKEDLIHPPLSNGFTLRYAAG